MGAGEMTQQWLLFQRTQGDSQHTDAYNSSSREPSSALFRCLVYTHGAEFCYMDTCKKNTTHIK